MSEEENAAVTYQKVFSLLKSIDDLQLDDSKIYVVKTCTKNIGMMLKISVTDGKKYPGTDGDGLLSKKGYCVYSIGSDFQDDHGIKAPRNKGDLSVQVIREQAMDTK